jgi:hypothetical protein
VRGLASSGFNFVVPALKVLTSNPRYFTDGSGRAIYLTGSHTWPDFVDVGTSLPVPAFDFQGYLNFLASNHHNFFRLWTESLSKRNWTGNPTPGPFYAAQHPWLRTGPGVATDGLPQFDLTQFDQSYFDRMRSRVLAAYSQGIYVSVMLFEGYHLQFDRRSDDGYALSGANNVNGVNDGGGTNSQNLSVIPPAVLTTEEAYVRKVIDTVNDLPNVLYEISNESGPYSTSWQQHFIDFVRSYEASKPLQHPVGFTFQYSGGSDSTLYSSTADWVSPAAAFPPNDGTKHVILNDTDHSFGWSALEAAGLSGHRKFVWENLTMGNSTLFMDPYLMPWTTRNVPTVCLAGLCIVVDPQWSQLRQNMGYAGDYAKRMNLAAMTPQGNLASTGYALANTTPSASEFLVYAPSGGSFTVNLSNTTNTLNIEWLNPSTGIKTAGGTIAGGLVGATFTTPFLGDAVLYLYDSSLSR